MRYHLKTALMIPPGVGPMGIWVDFWHCAWGTEEASSPEEAEAIFKERVARVLGSAREQNIGKIDGYISDAGRRIATKDFEVEEWSPPTGQQCEFWLPVTKRDY